LALNGCDSDNSQDRESPPHVSISDSAFRQAIRDGNVALVTTYLDDGYDVNRLGMGGENALHEGILHFDVAKLLIERGIRVNQKHKFDGGTPLIVATIAGNVDARTVKLLLDEGADPSITDTHGQTALDYALEYEKNHPEAYAPKIELLKAATD
jgi:ankyrin repeat protein